MELKVWVEGLPRVVSGVHEQTTCRDVIRALAQALGRPGRYSLVERWRDSERTVAPTVAVLHELRKFGDYATDVELVLCQTPAGDGESTSSTSSLADHVLDRHAFADSGNFSSSSVGGRNKSRLSAANGYVDGSSFVLNAKDNYMRDNAMRASDRGSSGNHRAGMIYADHHANNSLQRNSNPSRSLTSDFVQRAGGGTTTKPLGAGSSRDPLHASLPRQSKDKTYREMNIDAPLSAMDGGVKLSNGHASNGDAALTSVLGGSSDSNGQGKRTIAGQQGISGQVLMDSDVGLQYEELVRQIALQSELIQRNQTRITSLDKDVSSEEDVIRREERELAYEEGTLRRLEEGLDTELEELELVSWEGKLEQENEQKRKGEEQLANVRSSMPDLNSQLTQVLVEIKKLEKQIADEQNKRLSNNSEEAKASLQELRDSLSCAKADHETSQTVLKQLNNEIRTVEKTITDCNAKLTGLEEELKRANLNAVTNTSLLTEDNGSLSRSSSSRSNSSSHSSVQLQTVQRDIAPTPTDQQGMWV